jgi:signal transduction histidine kinase
MDDSVRAVTYRAGMSTSALARSVVDAARRSPGWLRRPWLVEVVIMLVLVVFAVFGTIESVQEGGNGNRQLDWLGWGLLGVAVLALAARRHRPTAVLLVTIAAVALSVAFGYPTGPIWATPLIALYSAAATGRRRLALLVGGALAAVPVVWRLLDRGAGSWAEVGVTVLLVALAVATGEVARGRRDYLAEAERRAVEAERTLQETARRRANEERLRLARDLHDVTAHTIAVIAIQASVADEALGGCEACPEPALQAVRAIRAASREAMAELKATVTMLRDGAAPRGPLPGLDQLEELVGMASGAGVRVELAVTGAARPLPPAVDLTAYRIVQESLTNVLRHARATSATVRVCYQPGAVEVEIGDDGRGSAPGAGSAAGHGLAVMAERAAAVGGRLEAGPGPDGGFRVHAWLPLGKAPP